MSSAPASPSSNVRLGLIIVGLAGVLAAIAFAVLNERGDDAVVARIGDQELTAGELHDILESAPAEIPVSITDGTTGRTLPGNIITTWLRVGAVRAELEALGSPSTDQDEAEGKLEFAATDLDLSSAYGRVELARAREVIALERFAAESVDPSTFEAPEYLCASHILLNSEQDALDIITLLDDGRDFAELAMEFSTGPSGPSGGDLGCGATAGYVPEFSDGARQTGIGVSAPVQSQFGFHVIEVRSIGPLSEDVHPEMDADEVAERLAADLPALSADAERIAGQAVVDDAFMRLDDVWVDPRYGHWNPVDRVVLPIRG